MTVGHVHSIESMGLVDGPGIRTVVFMQGCALRCRYCHNPDTWAFEGGEDYTPDALVQKLVRFKPYYGAKGGVTFSGGEPLMQPAFLLETLKRCKAAGISTCLDTAGFGKGDYDELLQWTDLVIFDVKHYQPEAYRALTGQPIDESLRFLAAVQRAGVPLWIRHVAVPTLTDGDAHLSELRDYLRGLRNVQRVELLPYHRLGVEKYRSMGVPYSLEDVPAMNPEALLSWQQLMNDDLRRNDAKAGGKNDAD